MDISVVTGMDEPQRSQEWADFMFCSIYLIFFIVLKEGLGWTLFWWENVLGKKKKPVQSNSSERLICVLLWLQILFAS